jgi:hypothetical protein
MRSSGESGRIGPSGTGLVLRSGVALCCGGGVGGGTWSVTGEMAERPSGRAGRVGNEGTFGGEDEGQLVENRKRPLGKGPVQEGPADAREFWNGFAERTGVG